LVRRLRHRRLGFRRFRLCDCLNYVAYDFRLSGFCFEAVVWLPAGNPPDAVSARTSLSLPGHQAKQDWSGYFYIEVEFGVFREWLWVSTLTKTLFATDLVQRVSAAPVR
jgi:hypothetical protein